MLSKLLITTSILITFICMNAQSVITAVQKSKIDQLFEPWSGKEVPGIAMGLVHKNKVIYKNTAGLANLSTKQLVDYDTKFQMSALSQQFVVFGILLLEEEGTLDLNSNIQSILPEFKKFEHAIKIKHLLSATSGLNDFWSLKQLGGWRDSDVVNQNDVLQFIQNQDKLAFEPGTEFEISYTNISVLAMILEKVSGMPLNDHLNEKVFKPLGMINTSFEDSAQDAVDGLAKPYLKKDNGYVANPMQIQIAGPLNLFSTVNDMSKWYINFYSKVIGRESAIDKLNSYAELDNGATYNQTRGTLTLGRGYKHPERGISKIYLNGWTGSYTISVYNFASEEMIGFVFSNGGVDYNGHLPMIAISDLLDDKFPLPSTTDFSKMNTLTLSIDELEKYSGHYWSDELSLSREILVENDTLRYSRGAYTSPLVPIGEDLFQMKMPSDDQIFVSFENDGDKKRFMFKTPYSDPNYSDHYEAKSPTLNQIRTYEGTYVNQSNGFVYKVHTENEKIYLVHPKNEPIELSLVFDDKFQAGTWYIDQVNFKRDLRGIINSMHLRGPGFGNITFLRLGEINEEVQ